MSIQGTRTEITISEKHVIQLILEFMENRELYISLLNLERETGIINAFNWSEDVLFLRQMIVDGQWDDVLEFIAPLRHHVDFSLFTFIILKHHFLELLCLRSEAQESTRDVSSEQLSKFLHEKLRPVAPSEEDFKHLTYLLTLRDIHENPEFKTWNPDAGRIQCFKKVLPLVQRFLQPNSTPLKLRDCTGPGARNDRLIQLIVKGLLYELCVEYCQAAATGGDLTTESNIANPDLLAVTTLSDVDVSLLSWLYALPADTFGFSFAQRTLKVNIDKLPSRQFSASWSNRILAVPHKVKGAFPFDAVPSNRPESTDILTRSLCPEYDGLSSDLLKGQHPSVTGDFGLSHSIAVSKNILFQEENEGGCQLVAEFQRLKAAKEERAVQKNHDNDVGDASKRIDSRTNIPTDETEERATTKCSDDRCLNTYNNGLRHSKVDEKLVAEGLKDSKKEATVPSKTELYNEQRQSDVKATSSPLVETKSDSGKGTPKPVDARSAFVKKPGSEHPAHPSSTRPKDSVNEDPKVAPLVINSDMSFVNAPDRYDSVENLNSRPTPFQPVAVVEDVQAIRAVAVHPSGKYFAVGSNSKMLRFCKWPVINSSKSFSPVSVEVVHKISRHHVGSIYCIAWHNAGRLVVTGSNDKLIKMVRFDPETCKAGPTSDLPIHNGTVRDLIFLPGNDSLLVSGGAGDCRIHLTDMVTQQVVRSLTGHAGHVYSLNCSKSNDSSPFFISGGQDCSIKLWDPRLSKAVTSFNTSSPVAALDVDSVIAAGHEDSSLSLWDMRSTERMLQSFRPHVNEIRSLRFSPTSRGSILSGSYDERLVISELGSDPTKPLVVSTVALHNDKVIQGRWHPTENAFVSTSADRTCVVWMSPSAFSQC